MSEVQTVKIDPDGKYVLLVEAEDPDNRLVEQLRLGEEILNKWWRGDKKFITFRVSGNIKVKFEKVGGEEVTGE